MSATDLPAAEEADLGECDGEKVVTMMDVLQEQQEFEEDANAVLGASDDKNCTYPKVIVSFFCYFVYFHLQNGWRCDERICVILTFI